LIDIAKNAGCDYVKFQKRDIDSCYTQQFLDSPRESPYGNTQRDQKQGIEFGLEEYKEINKYCWNKGIGWFASPWDVKSVYFLRDNFGNNLSYFKIPSALITDMEILEVIHQSNQSVIISTGMSTKEEVDNCLNYLGDQVEYILACTSTYPTAKEEMNLSFITTLKQEYGKKYKIGLSNHFPGISPMYVAYGLGAEMLEFHVTLDRSSYGSDQAASIEPQGVQKLCRDIRDFEVMMGNEDWIVFPSEQKIKDKLRKDRP
jgi:N-acetylneuraminate synthase